MKKEIFKKGFTLIELMIVIVILGVLMGTILPRLTGAQARARDTGRVADLNSIAQALETYYDDNGEYPGDGGVECLVAGEDANDAIAGYLKGSAVPTPPSTGQVTTLGGTSCEGSYAYAPLTANGLPNNGYVLASDVETYQNANFNTTTVTSITSSTLSSAFSTVKGTTLKDADAIATNTIYILVK